MKLEQAIIKAPGFEIPLVALDDWKVWVLACAVVVLAWMWIGRFHGKRK